MRRINPLFLSIGVVLISAAPIFSLAQAQDTSQARLLLDIQQMRQEIAELRDMVERQQYQLRKLQQSTSRSSVERGPRDGGVYASGDQQLGGISDSDPSSPQYGIERPDDAASDAGYSVADQGSQGAQSPNSDYQYENVDRPVVGEPSASGGGYQRTFPTQNRVEERVITAPRFPSQQGSEFPPVVDRSIGGSSNGDPQSGSGQTPTQPGSDQGPLSSQQDTVSQSRSSRVLTEAPLPGSAPPGSQQDRPGGGVIAVPNPARSTNNDGYNRPQVATASPQAQEGISAALSEDDYYRQGFDLMKQSKFDEAVTVFEQQLEAYPNGDAADDAHYWIAEAMYVSRNLDRAKTHLKTLVRDYPQSNRVPDAMLKTAYIEQQQGNQIEARILFQEIVNYHPKSDAAIAARNRLADSN